MDEYIKREAALALVRPDAPEDEKAAVTIATAKKLVRDIVRRTPAADVVPVVHSYWEHKITSYGEIVSSCHNCKYPVSQFWELANYCPNCGAKMDGGNENDR